MNAAAATVTQFLNLLRNIPGLILRLVKTAHLGPHVGRSKIKEHFLFHRE